jgi:hypothetical protein
MSLTKQSAKRKRRRTAVPMLGAAGLSLSLASGASGAPAANIAARHADMSQEFILAEEEVSDVSLATFYVFNKENAGPFRPSVLLARGGCGGGGGCGGRGCGGCGGRGCGGGCGGFRGCAGGGCGCVGFRGCGGCRGCVGFGGCGGGWWGGCGGGCCLSFGGCNYC